MWLNLFKCTFKFRDLLGDSFQRYSIVSKGFLFAFLCVNVFWGLKNAIATEKRSFSNQITFSGAA